MRFGQETMTVSERRSGDKEFVVKGNVAYYSEELSTADLRDHLTAHLDMSLDPEERSEILVNRKMHEQRRRIAAVSDHDTPTGAYKARGKRRSLPKGT